MIYAEEVNYWKTSKSSTDTWMDKIKSEIDSIGGVVEMSGHFEQHGQTVFMIRFVIGDNTYDVRFPTLPVKVDSAANRKAAKIQALTAVYHDVKSKCVLSKFVGIPFAFHSYLRLSDGRVAGELTSGEVAGDMPRLLIGGGDGVD